MKKSRRRNARANIVDCSYKCFLMLYPHCTKAVQDDLLARLRKQPRPSILCGHNVPENLTALSYGTLDDLRTATSKDDPVSECARILLGVKQGELLLADVNDVFGFANFVTSEIDKINKLFSGIKQSYSREEEAAGIRDLDFGSFGVLDWYARRMGITNQNDVRDVAWVRIYQCMKNDNMVSEFERRLHKQYMNNSNTKNRRR